MLVRKPFFYDRFRCIAGACPDSCCKEWDVQVDEASAQRYRRLPGPLGDKLRRSLYEEAGETYLALEGGRCPLWRADGLCAIQAELGEEGLCRTCRTYPRLTHDYGDFAELGLELSCPEAARLILTAPAASLEETECPGGAEGEYDREAMGVLESTRRRVQAILSDEGRPVGEVLALALLYGCQAQGELDGGETAPFEAEAALQEAENLEKPGSIGDILDFFKNLELLTPQWAALLDAPSPAPWERAHLAMARYLADRYWLQAVSDYDLYSRVKFMVISCLVVKILGGDIFRTAQLYSKEIENSAANADALLDAAYGHPAFTDDKLLWLLKNA